jgi:hypothetical protein
MTLGIIPKLRHVEHVLFHPSNEEVQRMTITVGALRTIESAKQAFSRMNYPIMNYPRKLERLKPDQMLFSSDAEFDVIRLYKTQFGRGGWLFDPEALEKRFQKHGLRACEIGEALALQLHLMREGGPETINFQGSFNPKFLALFPKQGKMALEIGWGGDYFWLIVPRS